MLVRWSLLLLMLVSPAKRTSCREPTGAATGTKSEPQELSLDWNPLQALLVCRAAEALQDFFKRCCAAVPRIVCPFFLSFSQSKSRWRPRDPSCWDKICKFDSHVGWAASIKSHLSPKASVFTSVPHKGTALEVIFAIWPPSFSPTP